MSDAENKYGHEPADAAASTKDASVPAASATTSATVRSPATTSEAKAASVISGDVTLAQALTAIDTLTNVYGFDQEVANKAVDAVGADVTACYNYILDAGLGQDQGGQSIQQIAVRISTTISKFPHPNYQRIPK